MKISLAKGIQHYVQLEDFKFQFDYQSRIARLLQNIELKNVTQFELELLPDQEIDDNDFQNTILYFEGFQSLKQFKIDTKHMNYLSPRTYKQILACLPQSLNQLDIFVSNKVDFEATTWISILESIGQRRLSDLTFVVANIFQISLTNKSFNLKIFDSQNIDQQNYQQIAQFCLNQDFKIFTIAIGNNTRVDRYLNTFDTVFRRKQIEELQINIGDSTSFQSESITGMIITNAFIALQTLKIQIGDQNSIDDRFAESIFLLLPSIKYLDLNVGHSNRLFQQQSQYVQPHQLEVLKLTLGRSNNFTKYGFTYLSNLVRSQSLIYLSLDLNETVAQDVSKSFYLFSCISNIRSLQSLKIILDRNFIFDSSTLALLGEIVKNNKNLKQFVFNPKQSQKNYIIMDSLLTQFDKSNIINLEIRFAQCFILSSADSLLALHNCDHLTSLKLIFVNDNGLSDFNICYQFGVNICAIKSLTTLHLEFDNQSMEQQEQNTAKIFQNLAEYIMIHRKDLILTFKYQDSLLISYNILSLQIRSQEVNNFDNYFPTKSIIIEQKNQEIRSSVIKWIARASRELENFQFIYKNFIFQKQNQLVSLKCPQQLLSLLYQFEPQFEINQVLLQDNHFSYVQFYRDIYYFLTNVNSDDQEYLLQIENKLMKIQIYNRLAQLELKLNIENVSEFVLFCKALEQLIPKIQNLELKFSTTSLAHIDWTNFDRAICASRDLRRFSIVFTQQQQQFSVEIFSKIVDSYFNIITNQPTLLHFDFELLFVVTFPIDLIEILEQQIQWEHDQQWDENGLAQFDEDGNIVPNQNQDHHLPQVPGIQNFDQHQHQVVKAQRLALLKSSKLKLDKIIQLKKQRKRILLQMMIAQKKFMNRFKKRKIIQEIIDLL
ncbi:hypothetical protein pb186bvf_012680 [Paramecium bursaria]